MPLKWSWEADVDTCHSVITSLNRFHTKSAVHIMHWYQTFMFVEMVLRCKCVCVRNYSDIFQSPLCVLWLCVLDLALQYWMESRQTSTSQVNIPDIFFALLSIYLLDIVITADVIIISIVQVRCPTMKCWTLWRREVASSSVTIATVSGVFWLCSGSGWLCVFPTV